MKVTNKETDNSKVSDFTKKQLIKILEQGANGLDSVKVILSTGNCDSKNDTFEGTVIYAENSVLDVGTVSYFPISCAKPYNGVLTLDNTK